jgi:hypothetical protein
LLCFLKRQLMKTLAIGLLFVAASAITLQLPAQTTSRTKTTKVSKKTTGANRSNASATGKARSTNKGANGNHYGQATKGSGRTPVAQYHGPKNVTPGSPVGTGGAGGGDMSGSPAGSQIETKDQTSKAVINTNGQATNGTKSKAKTKTRSGRKS